MPTSVSRMMATNTHGRIGLALAVDREVTQPVAAADHFADRETAAREFIKD